MSCYPVSQSVLLYEWETCTDPACVSRKETGLAAQTLIDSCHLRWLAVWLAGSTLKIRCPAGQKELVSNTKPCSGTNQPTNEKQRVGLTSLWAWHRGDCLVRRRWKTLGSGVCGQLKGQQWIRQSGNVPWLKPYVPVGMWGAINK